MVLERLVKIEQLQVDDKEPLRTEIETFLESVRTGSDNGVSAEDGLAAVELAERITLAVKDLDWGKGLT